MAVDKFKDRIDRVTMITQDVRVKGLRRRDLAALTVKAKQWGMTPAGYVKRLVEEDLAIARAAKTTTFAELMGPGQPGDESEIDQLVERARKRHFEKSAKRNR